MEYILFFASCLRVAWKNTWLWSKQNKLWIRLYFLVASTIALGLQSDSSLRLQAIIEAALSGVVILLGLLLSVLVVEATKAPRQLRKRALRPPTVTLTAHIRTDLIHRNWLSVREKLHRYKETARHQEKGPANKKNADDALSDLVAAIEDFGSLANSVTLDKVSLKRRRAARQLYSTIRGINHATDLELLEEEFNKLSLLW